MKSAEIRRQFLEFFASKGHQIVSSSSLVPGDDPTLLFTNAGMNQFKDVFLGFDKRPYTRATTAQKCVRAGGKHNDLENVGYTARHHTFFEMLGNFSFGDYFKHDAISFAWELLTQVYKLPSEKLWVTVYADDDEAYDIWTREIGVPAERVIRIGDNKGARYASDNFWMMGDTGPCGPCSEIFYDHGEGIWGGPPGSPDEDGDRYIEIWNNVFMQFNRDEAGVMHKLPRPSVDTGMGLERISAVLQHVHSNYEIDLFQNLIRAAARETSAADMDSPSLKVLADHIRACSFLVADGVIPGNAGRGYVLRRIIRRAIRHGYKLGARAAFFYKLVPDLVAEMGEAYPDLAKAQDKVVAVLREEEEGFFRTIQNGMEILETALAALKASGATVLDGELAFKLHDTYGFPLDLTADVCRERDYTVDAAGFDAAMARQREQARAAGKFKMAAALEYDGEPTTFHGYEKLIVEGAKVTAVYVDGVAVDVAKPGQDAVVVLDDTPFYAESGGQVGDAGVLQNGTTRFLVEDTQKIQADVFGHHGQLVEGEIRIGDTFTARVDGARRAATARNHSATHLLHKALREVLGAHVQQKGSQVDSGKTRFDFAHNAPLSDEDIRRVEAIVIREVLANAATLTRVLPIEEAQKTGAMMLFGEKYGDDVRVVEIGSTREFCGGTHVARTGDIGFIKIVAQSGVAAGIRRIEAVTGEAALALIQQQEALLGELAATLKLPAGEAVARVAQMQEQIKAADKEIAALKSQLVLSQLDELVKSGSRTINGVKVVAVSLDKVEGAALREVSDKIRDQLGEGVVLAASVNDGKVALVAMVSKALTGKVKAGEIVSLAAGIVGGKGGGRPDMAQAGGTLPEKLPEAIAAALKLLEEKL
ncbi:alanine--tRNA ligase [Niveibacterium terrae]|uniref:alanine--tRNA ligase n=1 Tax=Niveibacterium terrae TaxID=3373598 RepID=UPI003A90F768